MSKVATKSPLMVVDSLGWWKWGGRGDNMNKCVLARAKGRTVNVDELYTIYSSGEITQREFRAILKMDEKMGSESDRKVIQKLAKRLKVPL